MGLDVQCLSVKGSMECSCFGKPMVPIVPRCAYSACGYNLKLTCYGLLRMTKDGYDIQIQTNHLSHFLMTARLWPLMKATAEKTGDVTITQAHQPAVMSTG